MSRSRGLRPFEVAREHDACAIIAYVDKQGRSTHTNIARTIEALKKMAHRSGDINDEGDGCGVMTDIPRLAWSRRLEAAGLSPHLAEGRGFFVGHFLLPANLRDEHDALMARMRASLREAGLDLLTEIAGNTRDQELGPNARAEPSLFWQVTGMAPNMGRRETARLLFSAKAGLEAELPEAHIASLSPDTVVYKVRGVPELLQRVYPDLQDPDVRSIMTLGHSRYSTNTLPTVERAQPFALLGHNGEINTIERLRSTAATLNIPLVPGGSDSQDLDRILEGLMHVHGVDPLEAMEMLFPAIHSEVDRLADEEMRKVYEHLRWFFPPSAQGPAAIIARLGDVCLGSVDAMGLRPLWFGESDEDWFLSSEKGVVNLESTISDPKPLAPGEKIAIVAGRGRRAQVLDHGELQRSLKLLAQARHRDNAPEHRLSHGIPEACHQFMGKLALNNSAWLDQPEPADQALHPSRLAAWGWQQYELDIREEVARTGKPVVGSMGHQGPLACLEWEALPVISEFFKENVAVVTNPAIDREREADHFSTRVILGTRPEAGGQGPVAMGLELATPLLLERSLGDVEAIDTVVRRFKAATLEEVLAFFTGQGRDLSRVRLLDATFVPKRGALRARLDALCAEAAEAVEAGAMLLVMDDSRAFVDSHTEGRAFVDPALATAWLLQDMERRGLRRRFSLVVRSGAVRNLHDIMFLLGQGADALAPRLLWAGAAVHATSELPLSKILCNTMSVLQQGMEKVMSTMGIHELCGYGRIFASIGLARELAEVFGCPSFCSAQEAGLSLAAIEDMAAKRLECAAAKKVRALKKDVRRNVRVGKLLRDVAVGKTGFRDMADGLRRLEQDSPTALRHLLDFRKAENGRRPAMDDVDISIGQHDMPLVISAMSFGSQGENSFRVYAEAGRKANIVCMNGEGGEIPDMLGLYRHNRGQQIASGRFGVSMEFLNSANFLEIKIGQGAKPGEGGHLPGTKVTPKVAQARHCKPGVTLISPSNHHDIYSIEDLHQIITELKTANPTARISVKIPVTSGVGTIAVGVAKAGANIVTLSGFEGGTGAAREHAKKYVGLPAEIGVSEAHRALCESGLRRSVELWCDGGMRSGADVVRMVLLGADRVGLGTVALMGVGCISCQRCHLDRCPRGISTQLSSKAEAEARGVKGFSEVLVEQETDNVVRLLRTIGDEVRAVLADMGQTNLRELVGRTDLLVQKSANDHVDLADLLRLPTSCGFWESGPGLASRKVRRPLNHLTRLISDLAMQRFREGSSEVVYYDEGVRSMDRAIGTYLAGDMVRAFGMEHGRRADLRLSHSVPGNGLCAFTIQGIDVFVEGGAQDGPAKGGMGGSLAVLKGLNRHGRRVDGSAGKSLAYGAIAGTIMIQNMADSRACVRMSGADVVFGGRITAPVRDEQGNIASRAHLKGFAFEYMTGGRVVMLGDPGPWICSGMTGGVIYQCLYPEFGFTRESVTRRLATGAKVALRALDDKGLVDVGLLLGRYLESLRQSFQDAEADAVALLLEQAEERFVKVVPELGPSVIEE
ncbi:MAG: glutamate synthase-related protein [Desulfocurvibacter africanus]